jgi:hypothetical protein
MALEVLPDEPDRWYHRIAHAIMGAVGGLVLSLWPAAPDFLAPNSLLLMGVCAAVGGLLAFAIGDRFLEWLWHFWATP